MILRFVFACSIQVSAESSSSLSGSESLLGAWWVLLNSRAVVAAFVFISGVGSSNVSADQKRRDPE